MSDFLKLLQKCETKRKIPQSIVRDVQRQLCGSARYAYSQEVQDLLPLREQHLTARITSILNNEPLPEISEEQYMAVLDEVRANPGEWRSILAKQQQVLQAEETKRAAKWHFWRLFGSFIIGKANRCACKLPFPDIGNACYGCTATQPLVPVHLSRALSFDNLSTGTYICGTAFVVNVCVACEAVMRAKVAERKQLLDGAFRLSNCHLPPVLATAVIDFLFHVPSASCSITCESKLYAW